ncbi:Dymeclin [Gaertneriomyces semiglobifer]|nr:Dymeclin [Gaertneriomyces semiglobifer]
MAVDTLVAQDRRFRAQQLLEELLQTLIYADAGSQPNHDFYLEALNTFLVLLGTQLNQPLSTAADGSYFLEILLERLSHFAGGAMQRLLMNFVHRPPTPTPAGGGMLYSAYSYLFSARRQEGLTASPIADRSALLFLLLCMQTPTHLPNEYRNVLKRFLDSNVAESGEEVVDDEQGVNVSFRHVHQTLCGTIAVEEATVIMYCLIVHNRRFRTYVLSRTDPESLMIPLLHQIYDLTERKEGYPQLYVLLIILVIISEDDLFNDTLQRINVPYQAWYTERVVKSTSDAYVHALCIAVLSNMARNIVSISAMVAQRVLSFFDLVARRFARLCGQLPHEDSDDNLNATSFEVTDTELDTCIYYDLVALLLELINAILTHTLKQNPELVYALLHKREAFGQLADVPRFSSIVANIDLVIGYFHEKLEEANLKTPSAADVAGVIDRAAKTWNLSKLKTLSILKFQYEEDEESVNFFIPYVWNIVHKSGAVYWDSARISSGFVSNPQTTRTRLEWFIVVCRKTTTRHRWDHTARRPRHDQRARTYLCSRTHAFD